MKSDIKVIPDGIANLEYDDTRFKQTKLALIHAQCSRSAVLDPVGFVITEGEDIETLKELSGGKSSPDQINTKARRNLQAIKSCLRFPRMQAIVYVTRSVIEAENEKLVIKSVEDHNASTSSKHPYRPIPPLFSFDGKSAEKQTDRYYRHSSSEQANGCFVAVISRELEESRDMATILNRAAALGVLKDKRTTMTTEESGDTRNQRTKAKISKSRKSTAGKQPKKTTKHKSSKPVAFGSSSDSKI